MAEQKYKSILQLLIKVTVTVVCLWYVGQKINWTTTLELLSKANPLWLGLASILFVLSKIVSSIRLNLYFKNIDLTLHENINLKLYWLGMFYNLFLPGGIGGDAYKVILLHKKFNTPTKKLTAAVLLDRISGVMGLLILLLTFSMFIAQFNSLHFYIPLFAVVGVLFFYIAVKKIFPSFLPSFWSTLGLGLLVQALQVLCVYCILNSIGINENTTAYQLIFLLSSIVAIFPFTIGGLGAREIVFLWGSTYFLLDQHQAVYISILFYIITLFTSVVGIKWIYQSPLNYYKDAIQ